MKILIITQYFWPENFRINDLAQGLRDKGHEVSVLTGKPNYPGGRFLPGYGFFKRVREDYCGIKVVRVPLIPRSNGGSLLLTLNCLSFAFFASILGPFFCRDKYDVIFVYEPSPITVGLPALLLKKLCGAPIMFWVQDLWPETLSATGAIRSTWILKQIEKMVRYIYKGCDRILVQSEAFILPIVNLGAVREKIEYFPNSAEELYHPVSADNSLPEAGALPDGFRVMFAGNVGVAQDFATILGAAVKLKDYPDIHFVILGDGRMFNWVKEQVKRLNLTGNVHLLGRHPIETMPKFFAYADVMLATLKREPIFALTIPAKVQSYMACAKPLIAALEGEGARVVHEAGAGLTPPAEDPGGLADAVLAIYRMTEAERRDMGLRGRRYFEVNFERSMLLERLDGWLKGLGDRGRVCAS